MSAIEFKEYSKDVKLNLGSVLKVDPESSLKENQIHGIALACSYASKSQNTVDKILESAKQHLSEEEITASKSSASIMAMNNIYYRFVHLSEDKEYGKMPPKLRMNVIGNPGIDKIDFELYCLAISAINGCGLCIDSHVKQIEKAGVSKSTIQHTIRIASVINSVAQVDFIK